jgi:hypothetical protein
MFSCPVCRKEDNHDIKLANEPSENVAVQIFGNDIDKRKEIAVRNILYPRLLRM